MNKVRELLKNQQFVLVLVLGAMIAFFTIKNPIFFTVDVFGNITSDWAPVVLMAIGETFVIMSGGIDLSVGSTVGLSGVAAAFAMRSLTASHHGSSFTIFIGTLVAISVGLAVGLVNAFLITKARIVPFVATLATLGAARFLPQLY